MRGHDRGREVAEAGGEAGADAGADAARAATTEALTLRARGEAASVREAEGEREAATVAAGEGPAQEGGAELRTIGREGYAIEGPFAAGGIGRILRARDRYLDRPVALKELLVADRGAAERRFVREALLTARLQHPAIVPIYEAGRWPSGEPFYAMKLVAGRSLRAVIAERRTLDERLALLPNVLTVAEALAYAHGQGVIHRDLKPENVLVGEYGETVVLDWGLAPPPRAGAAAAEEAVAAAAGARGGATTDVGAGLTVAGAVMGTPQYMPPEQAEGRPVDARADVYALGAILYHLLTGAPPYEGTTAMAILIKVLSGPPAAVTERQPGVPRDLVALVDKAMARAPADRYPSAREFADDLRRFQTGKLVAAHHSTASERLRRWAQRNRTAVVVASIALVVVAAIGGASIRSVIRNEAEARAAAAAARAAEAGARAAAARALRRADELALEQARQVAAFVPNRTIELLAGLADRSRWRQLRVIAADAETHGVSSVFEGHTAGISRVTFSPDGGLVATTSDDCSVRLWDLRGGEHRVLTGHTDEVWRAVFSPDGSRLASTSKDGTVRLWEVATGAPLRIFEAGAPARAVAFVGDGARLVFSTDARELWSWDPGNGASKRITACEASYFVTNGSRLACVATDRRSVWTGDLDGEDAVILPVEGEGLGYAGAMSADGRWLAIAGDDGRVRLWDREWRLRLLDAGSERVRALAFSPDGALLVVGTHGPKTSLWRVATGTKVRVLEGASVVIRAEFSRDSSYVVGVASDPTIHLWSVADGAERRLVGFSQTALGVAFSPDNRRVAAVGVDGELRIWEPSKALSRRIGEAGAGGMVFHPREPAVWVGAPDGSIDLWDLEDASSRRRFAAHPERVIVLAYAPAGERLVSLDARGRARAWDLAGRQVGETVGVEVPPRVFAPVASGRRVIYSEGEALLVWEVDEGRTWRLGAHEERVVHARVSADGRSVVSGGDDGRVLRWDLDARSWSEIGRFETPVTAVVMSSDATVIASGSGDSRVLVHDLRRGEEAWEIPAEGLAVRDLALDPEGQRLAVAPRNTVLKVWDVETRTQVSSLVGHRAELIHVSFLDADEVASLSIDGEARLWDVASGEGRVLPASGSLAGVWRSPDRRALISRSHEGELALWRDDLPRTPEGFGAWLDAAWRPIQGPALAAEAVTACGSLGPGRR